MTPHSNNSGKTLKLLARLIPFLWVPSWNKRIRVISSLVLTVVMIGLNITLPLLFRAIINGLSPCVLHPTTLIIALLIGYGILWTISQLILQLRAMVLYRCLEHSMHLLALRIFDHLLRLSLRFHLERKTGAITSLIERAKDGIENIFWGIFLFLVNTIIEMVIVICILSYLYGFMYSSISLLVMIAYSAFTIVALQKSNDVHEYYNDKRQEASSRIVDTLINIETVKYFDNEKYDREQCDTILQEQEDAGTLKYFYESLIQIGQNLIIGVGLILMTWMSGTAVLHGKLTIGDFTLINGYLLQLIAPLNYFGYIIRQIRKGMKDVSSALNLLTLKPEIKDAPHAYALTITHATITFENVKFGYDERRPILKGISFTVPAGSHVAIVGATGSGKSTIARLLFRFYDVTGGRILINNHDIRNITQHSLHHAIGIVPQDTVLFNNTLYYNIAYGRPDATPEEVEHAIRMARLDTFIKRLPDGYNTEVGERGLKVSGGEKQRIAIARVLLKKPAIYMFDEATSALDTHTEREIKSNLDEISVGATALTIAHRLSTVINAHQIIVLDHGVITEQGTHAELLEKNGLYAHLWQQQIHE